MKAVFDLSGNRTATFSSFSFCKQIVVDWCGIFFDFGNKFQPSPHTQFDLVSINRLSQPIQSTIRFDNDVTCRHKEEHTLWGSSFYPHRCRYTTRYDFWQFAYIWALSAYVTWCGPFERVPLKAGDLSTSNKEWDLTWKESRENEGTFENDEKMTIFFQAWNEIMKGDSPHKRKSLRHESKSGSGRPHN